MKSRTLTCITAMVVFVALAIPLQLTAQQTRYTVTDLGTLGGTFSLGAGINNKRGVSGFSTLPGDTQVRAFLWQRGVMIDLGTLGGPNSFSFFPLNERDEVTGGAEPASTPDPNGEDFCGFVDHLICLPFLWRDGAMTALPTLGGNNGLAFEINNRGQVAGVAENTTLDPTCVAPQSSSLSLSFGQRERSKNCQPSPVILTETPSRSTITARSSAIRVIAQQILNRMHCFGKTAH